MQIIEGNDKSEVQLLAVTIGRAACVDSQLRASEPTYSQWRWGISCRVRLHHRGRTGCQGTCTTQPISYSLLACTHTKFCHHKCWISYSGLDF